MVSGGVMVVGMPADAREIEVNSHPPLEPPATHCHTPLLEFQSAGALNATLVDMPLASTVAGTKKLPVLASCTANLAYR